MYPIRITCRSWAAWDLLRRMRFAARNLLSVQRAKRQMLLLQVASLLPVTTLRGGRGHLPITSPCGNCGEASFGVKIAARSSRTMSPMPAMNTSGASSPRST